MNERPSPLQREIRQTRPFRSASHEAAVGLLRTADFVRRRLAVALEPHGVTPQQYNVLRILRGAGEAGVPTLEIAERMIEQAPGITRLLDRIEAKGWVERRRCTADRRQVLCNISEAGLALLAALDEPIARVDEECVAALSAGERSELIGLLDAVRGRRESVETETNRGPEPLTPSRRKQP